MHLPSTTINAKCKLSIRRVLPAPGQVLVHPGQRIEPLTVVARAELPSDYCVIDVARQLGRPHIDMDEVLDVELDEYVEANEIVASTGGLPFWSQTVRTPAAGRVISIGPGWILLETARTITEIQAFINGTVSRVIPDRGVVIETRGAKIEAACGFGGEAYGRLKRLASSRYEDLDPDKLNESHSESIVLGGRSIDEEGLRQADTWKVRGIVVGSIPAALSEIEPPVRVRVVATEGFGSRPMSAHAFGILSSLSRKEISIRGQMPASLRRNASNSLAKEPPIIIATSLATPTRSRSYSGYSATTDQSSSSEAKVGSRVRVVQGKLLGASGVIDLIPPEPHLTEAGIMAPGAYVKLGNDVHFIPWANLMLIK